jgi:hypothetical protein
MIKGKFDMPKLERSLKRYAKDFGDTTAQAVLRWDIQVNRELAIETQAWGKSGTLKKQSAAMETGALQVILVVESLQSSGKGFRVTNQGKTYHAQSHKVLSDSNQVNAWIEENRTGSRGYTKRLPVEERRVCTIQVFKRAMRDRSKLAGMAKGGWIGAGNDMARHQKGSGRMTIGVGFLKYAQKHSGMGSSAPPVPGWKPVAKSTNKIRYTASNWVMKSGAFDKASAFGLKKTISWYRHALKAIDRKKP